MTLLDELTRTLKVDSAVAMGVSLIIELPLPWGVLQGVGVPLVQPLADSETVPLGCAEAV